MSLTYRTRNNLKHVVLVTLLLMAFLAEQAMADRVKDLASVAGVRDNQLVGYGLVVGLSGTGDQTTQTPFTVQSIINMLTQFGVTIPPASRTQTCSGPCSDSITFDSGPAGTYSFNCSIHPTMEGTFTVQ